jgi:acetyl-CoA synthetase
LQFFDHLARSNEQAALILVDEHGVRLTASFEEMRRRSNRAANFLRQLGLRRGDRILVMLDNVPNLWDIMLGAMKLGCPMVPTTTLMGPSDLATRVERANVRAVVTRAEFAERFPKLAPSSIGILAEGDSAEGWHSLSDAAQQPDEFEPTAPTAADDLLLLYFTSGTTATPKLVVHTHASYPIGHLTTMYWLGLRPGDRHLNLSSAGWAKHAYSSFLAPWSAGATVVAMNTARFDAAHLLRVISDLGITTFCAPPTVWRSLVQHPLDIHVKLREVLSAGEPLNAEIIQQVRKAWNLTVREGYGQTETTLVIGNFPGEVVRPGSMGRVAPGFDIALRSSEGVASDEGEITLDLSQAPVGVTPGYADDEGRTAALKAGGVFHTGDIAQQSADGYFSFVGRNDDVFKSSDYRISPFELESVLIEHEAVQEAAVVPSADAQRLAVPKAFVVLAPGYSASAEVALTILQYVRKSVAPYMRIRRIQFCELPKTISGKIRRVELRSSELVRDTSERKFEEYWEEDFPQLRRRAR